MMLVLIAALVSGADAQDEPAEDWPRVIEKDGTRVVMYQPQIDRWDNFEKISARVAVAVTLDGAEEPEFGSLRMAATTSVDFSSRSVLFGRREIAGAMFPDTDAAVYATLREAIGKALPNEQPLVMSLDEIVAYLDLETSSMAEVEVNLEPPPILWSHEPAILILFIGEPRFEKVEGIDQLLFAVNTNWDLFLDMPSSQYCLLNGESWLTASNLEAGSWTAAFALPEAFGALPDDANWAEVKQRLSGAPAATVPRVLVAHEPTELIITDGMPQFSPIQGTELLHVANTDSDLFLYPEDRCFYLLTAGRWFRAKDLEGPWSAATRDLPAEFAEIPPEHEVGYVLASVPGTPEAQAAVLLASVPRTATIRKSEASVSVVYDGQPDFAAIKGADGVSYAVNTPYNVFFVTDNYYCCYQGVWFAAPRPNGPWSVCASVPDAIYTIPSTSPVYNVTYVRVESSTPDTVVVSQTAGYTGQVIAAGLLMFGLGYALSEADDVHVHYHYGTHYYSYGCAARYDYYHGGYYRAARAYGPYGGAGRAAAYNPATGTYARGAYHYGPRGGAFAREAYNPHTDRYAGRVGAANPYGSWSRSVVADDDDWVRAGHRSGLRGTAGAIETSEGGAAIGARGRYGRGGMIARGEDGDVYAGANGNVFRRTDDGDWQQRDGDDWKNVDSGAAQQRKADLQRQHEARARGAQRSRTFQSTTHGTRSRGAGGRGGRRR